MDYNINLTQLQTRKNDLTESRLIAREEHSAVDAGEILLKIERFSLTTNNITYAAYGDSMGYWQFFPTGDDEWGHMPVWGYADVLASGVEGIEPGERFYGYFPMASHIRMLPERVTDRGFYDGTSYRQTLPSAYNQYTRCSWDRYYRPDTEDLQILLKPLFLTSAMLADFLADNDFFGAQRLVFSSASSKTAYAAAVCLADYKGVTCSALTSARNKTFVERLGCYQDVKTYDELEQFTPNRPTLYIDLSGDLELRDRVHGHFGYSLVYSCFVGSTHTTDEANLENGLEPKPQFFFAPVQIRKRNADWGPQRVSDYIGQGLVSFYHFVSQGDRPLMSVVTHNGLASAGELVADLCNGRVPADEGHVVTL